MKSITFRYLNKEIRAYEFMIAGQRMVGLTCETLIEYQLVKTVKAVGYPYMSLDDFCQHLIQFGLIETQPIRDDLVED